MSSAQTIITTSTTYILLILVSSSLSVYSSEDYYTNLASTLGAPFIDDGQEITVLPTENRTLKCSSNKPVTWRKIDDTYIDYKVRSTFTPDIERPYGSILDLNNIDYKYVRYYYCVNNASIDAAVDDIEALLTNYDASQIYLFVFDPQNPVAHVDWPMLTGEQFSEVTIPCKPTSREASVELKKSGGAEEFDSIFNPTTGFTVKLMHLSDGGTFTCRPKNDETGDKDIHFDVQVDSGTNFINKPYINSTNDSYGIENQELELDCYVEAHVGVKFIFNWTLPHDGIAENENRVEISNATKVKTSAEAIIGHSKIKVKNLDRAKDIGLYKCGVITDVGKQNSNQIFIKILGENESVLEIFEPTNSYTPEISSTKHLAKLIVKYQGYPRPNLDWYDNHGIKIQATSSNNNDKYEVNTSRDSTLLKIRNPNLNDSGSYTLKANNGLIGKELTFKLMVKDRPSVKVEDVYVMVGQQANLTCICDGYPASTITWSFTPCSSSPKWPECDRSRSITYSSDAVRTTALTDFTQQSQLLFKPTQAGVATCTARNSEKTTQADAEVLIGDLEKPLHLWGISDDPIANDDTTLTCGASIYKYGPQLHWYLNEVQVENSDDVEVITSSTEYSFRTILRWKPIKKQATGHYVCRAHVQKDDSFDDESLYIDVKDPMKPEIDLTNINEDQKKVSLGEALQMQCKFTGMPRPTIQWLKDNVPIEPDSRIGLFENNTLLDIKFIKEDDEGKYRCEGFNKHGSISRETVLKITNIPKVSKALIIGIASIILILVIFTIYLILRIRRERKLLKELKAAGLANFEEGNPDSINPELALDEQADLLPYDKKYEFPREKLKMGKQLGAGAFGVVVKAFATGIVPYEDETTVAVKMVKQTADNEVMRALISELKIMVHLGQHLNVVNLLGAVTKNIAKREVMVIVEYCRYGNLQNFLIRHREYFVDQILRDQDIIDPNILTKEQRWSNDSGYEYYNSHGLKYVKLSFTNNNHKISGKNDARKSSGAGGNLNSKGYIRHSSVPDYFPGGMDSANTEATLISRNTHGGEDNLVMSNNSVQPAWRSNYRMDYKGPARTVTTTDLLCWSFQVARGMHYLASRKVLHGDLAARNILLCDDNVVKICDFGLARSMYKSDNYKKKGESPLPFKWLAIESISDQVFSTYSDVWSFGIVLWELFSLGKVPYPGMDADQGLYFKLKDGYRMEKPENATQDIYDIMLQCWCAHPESRPLFDSLEKSLGKLLESGVAEHYIDLNEPYLQMNVNNFTEGQTDYLALMAAPECQAPAIPNYVNSGVIPIGNAPPIPDYLTMSPTVNSPLGGDGGDNTHFQFPSLNSPTTVNNLNASPTIKLRTKNPDIPEEIPMLKRSNQSISTDSETEFNSKNAQNPSNRNDLRTQPKDMKKNINVLNTAADNYVNVPSTIINMNSKDAVSNPGYVVVNHINETRT